MPTRPPVLEEEHVEEILLRFAPDQPAGLFRAALVCRSWCRLISGPAFRRRYREFHCTPPVLGFLSNGVADDPDGSRHISHFVPRRGAAICFPPSRSRRLRALDARHGRILLQRVEEEEDGHVPLRNPFQRAAAVGNAISNSFLYEYIGVPKDGARGFFVSVPIITKPKERRRGREVPIPSQGMCTLAAAVLCSDTTGACDHLDCHSGHFLVVFVGYHPVSRITLIYTYSSETATWSAPISTQRHIGAARLMPSAYVGNALYFGFRHLKSILKYDLQLEQISWIELPSICTVYEPNVFTTTETGVLGLATIRDTQLYIWSLKDAPQVDDAGWTQPRVIELQKLKLLTVSDVLSLRQPHVVGFADGIGVIFFWANGMIRAIDLKTYEGNKQICKDNIYTLIPYISFCTPALGAACTGEGPSSGGSSA